MSVKVKNGAPVYGPSVSETAERALIVKGYRESGHVMACQATWPEMQVCSRCGSARDSEPKAAALRDMEEIAWTLVPRGPKRKAGFVPPSGGDAEVREIALVLKAEE